MNTLFGRPAFSVGAQPYTWRDVVAAAIARGDWAPLEDQTRRGLALVERASETGLGPDEKRIEEAADEFRYERDLIAAEEMEVWLAARGLEFETWMDYIERAMHRQESSPAEADEALALFVPDPSDLRKAIESEAICSGVLQELADKLAARVALVERASPETVAGIGTPSPEEAAGALPACNQALARLGLPEESDSDRLVWLQRLERIFQALCQTLASPDAIRSQIEAHRLDWIRLDLASLKFSDESAAREASLCLRQDGESLEDVARSAHVAVEEERFYLEDVDPGARPDLLSARPGEFVGPLAMGEQFHLFLLRDKAVPSEKNPEVRQLARDTLVKKIVEQESVTRVQWHERV